MNIKTLKISIWMNIGYGVLIVLATSAASISVWYHYQLLKEISFLAEDRFEKSSLLMQFENNMHLIDRVAHDLLSSLEPDQIQIRRISELREVNNQLFWTLKKMVRAPEGVLLIDDLKKDWDLYGRDLGLATTSQEKKFANRSEEPFSQSLEKRYNNILKTLDAALAMQKRLALDQLQNANLVAQTQAAWAIAFALLTAATGGIVTVALKRHLYAKLGAEPLELKVAALRAAEGDLSMVLNADRAPRGSVLAALGELVASHALRKNLLLTEIEHGRQVEMQLQRLAFNDNLTSLGNRNFFIQIMDEYIKDASEDSAQEFTLLYLDVDGFKDVNDAWGHDFGDQLLYEIGQRLRESLRKTDAVFRLGGDEFAIILLFDEKSDQYNVVVDYIVRHLAEPYYMDGRTIHVSASVGCACFPRDGTDRSTLMKHADEAMYHAKRRGKNQWQAFDEEISNIRARKLAILECFRSENYIKYIWLAAQPQVNLSSGNISGFEILARMRHPIIGDISPDEFVPAAEDAGAICQLGAFVLRQAARLSVQWRNIDQELTVSVNISPAQLLDERHIAELCKISVEENIAPGSIEFEITESIFMNQDKALLGRLAMLREHGFVLALDDFGTGYSCLSYLDTLHIDTLKIDKSFLLNSRAESQRNAIISCIIAIGSSLNLKIIAEGVENKGQERLMSDLGCDYVQGYMYGRPMPIGDVADFIAAKPSQTSAGAGGADSEAKRHTLDIHEQG